MKCFTQTCLLLCTATTLVVAQVSEVDTRLRGTPDTRRDLTLLAKPGSTRPSSEARRKAAKLAGEQLIIQTQLTALETTIKDLNAKRERLEARQKEITTQLGIAEP